MVKVHDLAHGIRLFSGCDVHPLEIKHQDCPVDAVFQTHRDLGPQTASNKRMAWLRKLYPSDLDDPVEFCRKQKRHWRLRPYLTDKDWTNMDTSWILQSKAIITCHREWYKAAGSKLVLDTSMENMTSYEKRLDLANKIVEQLQRLDPDFVHDMDPVKAVEEADKLRPLGCSSWLAVNPNTHFHRGHVIVKNDRQDSNEFKAPDDMNKDPIIQQWRKEFGYAVY